MRKRLITSGMHQPSSNDSGLNLEEIATIEFTSEDPKHPFEHALRPNDRSKWRAADPGRQLIRICFDQPQQVRGIALEFDEHEVERTQEYVLRWSRDSGSTFREIVRQQFNFSPPDATHEAEHHRVELNGVDVLEFAVTPDISGGDARASLSSIRLT